ncbi:lipopolysaccharide biosynthesis protein [Nesterenkonia natronophila]|uniref:Lipopolysaccharide biosynthesis protein n=1 Tax=Nesterenkonia natronophila TaxID=2174932 RepID=A0A3A4G0G9_9MICC|nr:hypothetical protein [Nesterenkonia natronophila]RJN31599.1 hypothetical protein D3250_05460 [Nesterenkonia natronophila]
MTFAAGSLSWAGTQWVLVWLFARFAGGAEAVGQYSLVLAIATPIFVACHLGLRTVYLSLSETYRWSTYLTLRLGGILLGSLLVTLYFSFFVDVSVWLWGAVLLMKCADTYLDLGYAQMQRRGMLRQIGTLNLVNSSGTIALAILALWLVESVAAAILGSALVSWALVVVVQRAMVLRPAGDRSARTGYRRVLAAGVPTMISDSLAVVANYLPILLLARIADEAEVGVYTTAAFLLIFTHLSGSILSGIWITSFRLTFEIEGSHVMLRQSHRMATALIVIGLLAVPVVIAAGSPALQWVFGPEFGMTYAELTLLAVAALPIMPTYVYTVSLNVLNRFAVQAWVWALACGFGSGVSVLVMQLGATPMTVALSLALGISWGRSICVLLLVVTVPRRQSQEKGNLPEVRSLR